MEQILGNSDDLRRAFAAQRPRVETDIPTERVFAREVGAHEGAIDDRNGRLAWAIVSAEISTAYERDAERREEARLHGQSRDARALRELGQSFDFGKRRRVAEHQVTALRQLKSGAGSNYAGNFEYMAL